MIFWDIVESSSAKPLRIERSAERLVSMLTKMDALDVLDFCREFDRRMDEAYTWELWGVAYLINGGCSDDSFMDFRSSLIAQGRAVYECAIRDAESLVSLDTGELEEMFEEGYLYAPTKAYEQINGSQPDTGVTRKTEPSGTEWNETRASLQELFPRAWALYGWEEAKSPPPYTEKAVEEVMVERMAPNRSLQPPLTAGVRLHSRPSNRGGRSHVSERHAVPFRSDEGGSVR